MRHWKSVPSRCQAQRLTSVLGVKQRVCASTKRFCGCQRDTWHRVCLFAVGILLEWHSGKLALLFASADKAGSLRKGTYLSKNKLKKYTKRGVESRWKEISWEQEKRKRGQRRGTLTDWLAYMCWFPSFELWYFLILRLQAFSSGTAEKKKWGNGGGGLSRPVHPPPLFTGLPCRCPFSISFLLSVLFWQLVMLSVNCPNKSNRKPLASKSPIRPASCGWLSERGFTEWRYQNSNSQVAK